MYKVDYSWRRPNGPLVEWMEGQRHTQPPTSSYGEWWYSENRRRASFLKACRTADPQLALWPEFQEQIRKLGLLRAYEKGTISQEVAGLLIASGNRSVGSWLKRAKRMERSGKDPLKRRRYCRAMHQLYQTVGRARQLAELRRFEQEAIRAMTAT